MSMCAVKSYPILPTQPVIQWIKMALVVNFSRDVVPIMQKFEVFAKN